MVEFEAIKKPVHYLTTTLPKRADGKHPVQIYNGHKFIDKRNDKPSGIDLYAWQLKANAQPLYKQLQQARKVLTTHDWMVIYIYLYIGCVSTYTYYLACEG